MIRNEKGFAYPLTFCVLLFASMLLMIQLEQYGLEKKFLKEAETLLKQDYYFLSSVKQAEKMLVGIGEDERLSGVLMFSDGYVKYYSEQESDSLFKITYQLKIGSAPELKGVSYYDKELGKMVKWMEKQ